MIEASIDIQHIMDYLPITYALQQQDVSKTMVDLKLLKEIPIDSSVNQCQGFCYNSKKDVFNYYTSRFQLVQSKDIDVHYDDYNNNGAFANDGKTIFATLFTVITVDKTGNVTKITFFPKNLKIEDMDMRHNIMYAAVNMNHKVFIYTMLNY